MNCCCLMTGLLLSILTTTSHANLITNNAGFESGPAQSTLYNVPGWPQGFEKTNGMIVADAAGAHSGTNYLMLKPSGRFTSSLGCWFYLTNAASSVVQLSGWVRTGPNQTIQQSAQVWLQLSLADTSGKDLGFTTYPNIWTSTLRPGTNWMQLVTQPFIVPVNTAKVWVSMNFCSGMTPADTNYPGDVFFDDISLDFVPIPSAGAIQNPGFEVIPFRPMSAGNIPPCWTDYGNAFGVISNYSHSGEASFGIWYGENLVGQDFAAAPGTRYEVSGYMASFTGIYTNSTFGALILSFLDVHGAQIGGAELSEKFTWQSPTNTWLPVSVSAVAPEGTVTARIFCGATGGNYLGGTILFDDLTQRVVSTEGTVSGLLHNPGFDDGPAGNAYSLGENDDFYHWFWLGGTNAGFVVSDTHQAGYQSLVTVWPNNLAAQEFTAEPGMSYVLDGYIMTPNTSEGLQDATAFASLLLEFFNPEGAAETASVSVVSTEKITATSAKGVWHHVCVTNRAPWGGPVTGRVSCAFLDQTAPYQVAKIYFDSLTVTATNIPAAPNTSSGALWNPGFEYTPDGTKLPYVDNWYNLGFDGMVDSRYVRSGSHALKLSWTETLLAQNWPATPGFKYETSGWVSSSPTEPFTGSTNVKALVILQFLDATGTNVLSTYNSALYQPTNNAVPGVWMPLFSRGVAPEGTVYGRTLCALVGNDSAFSGAVWFDDLDQSLVSTGGSVSGLLLNPGFDDGITGNAFTLAQAGNLLHWSWAGGTNAGFVIDTWAHDGGQALALAWPANYASQAFSAIPGERYVFSGYLFTPSGVDQFTSDGMSYGCLSVSYYIDGSTTPVLENTAVSEPFTVSSPVNTWVYFCMTSTVPLPADPNSTVTGLVSCVIQSPSIEDDLTLGGIICFDSLSLVYLPREYPADYSTWLMNTFGFTNGPRIAMEQDYDSDGFDNWSEFTAGTDPANANAFLALTPNAAADGTRVVLSWPSTAGRFYRLCGTASTALTGFSTLANNIAATPPLNTCTSVPPSAPFYYRIEVSTNAFK